MKIITQQAKVSFAVMSKLSKCIASLMENLWGATSANLITPTLASVRFLTPPKRGFDLKMSVVFGNLPITIKKGKLKMKKKECSLCYGTGHLYYGDEENFDVTFCDVCDGTGKEN
jgi:hypothetical protein